MEIVRECTYEALNLDEACVGLANYADAPDLWLYTLSSDCHDCPYSRGASLPPSHELKAKVNTARSQYWRVLERPEPEKYIPASSKNGSVCQIIPQMGQYGIYELAIQPNGTCDFSVQRQPTSPYTALAIACLLIILLLSSLSIIKRLKSRAGAPSEAAKAAAGGAKKRVRSLDAVRGASILLMIFVNNGAGGYPLLEHATWDGLHVGDLVFPCFMWIMGVCVPLSVSSLLSRGTSRPAACWAIVKRSFYLFCIGLSLNTLGKTQLEDVRIFGVLQRFSLAYLVVGVTYALTYQPNSLAKWKGSRAAPVADLLIMLPQWAVAFLVLILHCWITFGLPLPDCPKGYLGPGGLHADGKYWNCTGGATGYLDKILLGEEHVYQLATARAVYASGVFEPEGVLGCLTSIFQVFLGVHAGQILRAHKSWRSRLARWISWGLLFGLIALALHYTRLVPINKNLWSFSFVMITTCFSLGLLSLFCLLIDVAAVWEGGPFRIPGMNALVMYVGHQVFSAMLPFHWRVGPMNTHAWLLAESLWCVALWAFTAYVLHWKKIYVRL